MADGNVWRSSWWEGLDSSVCQWSGGCPFAWRWPSASSWGEAAGSNLWGDEGWGQPCADWVQAGSTGSIYYEQEVDDQEEVGTGEGNVEVVEEELCGLGPTLVGVRHPLAVQ